MEDYPLPGVTRGTLSGYGTDGSWIAHFNVPADLQVKDVTTGALAGVLVDTLGVQPAATFEVVAGRAVRPQ